MGLPTAHCVRPCHDCPFRTDVPSYMSTTDAANNVKWSLSEEDVAICHHSCRNRGEDGHIACAGGLLFALRLGVDKRFYRGRLPLRLLTDIPVYENVEQLAAAGLDEFDDSRHKIWLSLQPRRPSNGDR